MIVVVAVSIAAGALVFLFFHSLRVRAELKEAAEYEHALRAAQKESVRAWRRIIFNETGRDPIPFSTDDFYRDYDTEKYFDCGNAE